MKDLQAVKELDMAIDWWFNISDEQAEILLEKYNVKRRIQITNELIIKMYKENKE